MNAEQQRIAIAEAVGFKDGVMITKTFWAAERSGSTLKPIPHYLEDLNAMHEVVKTLSDSDYTEKYQEHLVRICGFDIEDGWDFRPLQEATAAQRAEAFLRTLNLWKE